MDTHSLKHYRHSLGVALLVAAQLLAASLILSTPTSARAAGGAPNGHCQAETGTCS